MLETVMDGLHGVVRTQGVPYVAGLFFVFIIFGSKMPGA